MRRIALIAAAALVAAPSIAQKITEKENDLLAAGFVTRPATTPARQEMIARLPNKKFVRTLHGGTTSYVYADRKNCNCLYVGSEQAYGAYRRQRNAENLVAQQQMAAMDYRDAAWNWGAWGPYTGGWGRFGFGRGFGW